MDVFFYEAFDEEARELAPLLDRRLTYGITDKTIQEAGHLSPPAKLISIRTQSVIPIHWAKQLEGVLSRSTGYDHLKKYLDTINLPLPCGYLKEYATRAVAEHAILLLICLMRALPQQIRQFNCFQRNGLTGAECAGRNLLIVGVGRIGSEIASIASALGMNVRGVDIVQRHHSICYTTKEEGFSWADAIICAMNLTDENHSYFSYDALKICRQGIVFVNIARGEHAPIGDLFRLICDHHMGGLGIDVFDDEPQLAVALRDGKEETSPVAQILKELLKHPNVLCTPHNAFNTIEALRRKAQFSVDEIFFFMRERAFSNRVHI